MGEHFQNAIEPFESSFASPHASECHQHGLAAQAVALEQGGILSPRSVALRVDGIWQNEKRLSVDASPSEKAIARKVADRHDGMHPANDRVGESTGRRLPGIDAVDNEENGSLHPRAQQPSDGQQVQMGANDEIKPVLPARRLQDGPEISRFVPYAARHIIESGGQVAGGFAEQAGYRNHRDRVWMGTYRAEQVSVVKGDATPTAEGLGDKGEHFHGGSISSAGYGSPNARHTAL